MRFVPRLWLPRQLLQYVGPLRRLRAPTFGVLISYTLVTMRRPTIGTSYRYIRVGVTTSTILYTPGLYPEIARSENRILGINADRPSSQIKGVVIKELSLLDLILT
jgi:hypothetical protein